MTRMTLMLAAAKAWARAIKRDIAALWIAARDRRTPWYAKLTAGLVAGYALSPIDLIPDFIPVIGYLDDLLIVPLGIKLVVAMIPPALMIEFRAEATRRTLRPTSYVGALAIGAIWIRGRRLASLGVLATSSNLNQRGTECARS